MEEITRQAVIIASILSFILSFKITFDLTYTFITNRKQASMALLSLFVSIALGDIWFLVMGQMIVFPLWLRAWLLAILALSIIGQYMLLQEIDYR